MSPQFEDPSAERERAFTRVVKPESKPARPSNAVVGPADMKRIGRLTVVEWLTILFIVAVLGGLLLPDSATMTRWQLEKRARDFVSADVATLSDESIIVTDPDIAGTWTCRHRMDGSEFTFSRRGDGQFDVDFSTSGCLGKCDLRRAAKIDKGIIRLDAAVAEYRTRTYNTLYVIRIDGSEYLLPADGLSDFEQEVKSGSGGWEGYVFRRGSEANEQSRATEGE